MRALIWLAILAGAFWFGKGVIDHVSAQVHAHQAAVMAAADQE